MASWQDGPEYAPLERPSAFDPSGLAPLDQAPPFVQPAANAPAERPRFDGPGVALAPLAALVPAEEGPRRDPHEPFAVASSTLTETTSAWSAARGTAGSLGGAPTAASAPGQAGAVQAGPVQATPVQAGWGPPTGDPVTAPPTTGWPPPDQPLVLTSAAPPSQNGFAAPGSNAWFGAPPLQQPAPWGPRRVTAGEVWRAVTPGVWVTLGLGILFGLLTSITPLAYAIAWVLATRIRVARKHILRSFTIGLGVIILLWLISLALSSGYLTGFEILSRCTLAVCLGQLVSLPTLAYLGLRRGEQPAPPPGQYPPRSPWG
ncbi:hypothetical protein FHX74_002304 [Friedmanniella endophytica]|uniref:Uncharacterized protein n=1 Tax=Microlunatus kandeliicorticis TaxID=1759536 RepID=A0A7W3P694_9ACTN|nr:hypothetical protein [Microlunatus kandeliicorticis]MBA8794685.1 hypothetical protein [Microlunatus kandeliicorticis]